MDTRRSGNRFEWIEDTQSQVGKQSFWCTRRGIETAMGKQGEFHDKINAFKENLCDTEHESTEQLVEVNQSLSWLSKMVSKKQVCLETLMSISDIEKRYQETCSVTDQRASQIKRKNLFVPVPKTSNNVREFVKSLKECSSAVHSQWAWLRELQQCAMIHMNNAAQYHKFFLDVDHCQQGLESLIMWFNKKLKSRNELMTFDIILEDLTNILLTLLEQQDKVDELICCVSSIVPIRWRFQQPTKDVQVTALADYHDDENIVSEGEAYTLLDNSDTFWKVKDRSGQELSAPAALFLIPPVDREAVDGLHSLRGLLKSVWRLAVKVFRALIVPLMTERMRDTSLQKVTSLDRDSRDVVLNHLHDMVEKLEPHLMAKDKVWQQAYVDFSEVFQDLYRGIHENREIQQVNDYNPEAVKQEWDEVGKVIRKFEDLCMYADCSEDSLNESFQSHSHVLTDQEGGERFVTKAYIDKMKPLEFNHVIPVEIEHPPPEEDVMYIHEKHPSQEEVLSSVTEEIAERIILENIIETEVVEDVFSHQTVNETMKWCITGVIDPSNSNNVISLFDAVEKGILDQQNGIYRNPVTGEEIQIVEAMEKGLIRMEMVDTSTVVESEGQNVVRREIKRTANSAEEQLETFAETIPVTVRYQVVNVRDPRTGADLSPEQAVKTGVINKDKLVFVNPVTSEELPLEEACRQGFVDLVSLDEAAEQVLGEENECLVEMSTEVVTTPYAVDSVIDPRTKYEISLSEAKRIGIIDEKNGLYKNPRTEESISIKDAIEKGVVKCAPLEEGTDVPEECILPVRVQQQREQRFYLPLVSSPSDPSEAAMMALLDQMNGDPRGVRTPQSDDDLTLTEAGQSGVLKYDALEYIDSNGEPLLIQEAGALSYIKPDSLKNILDAYKTLSLGKLIDDGTIDPVTGMFRTPNGDMVPIGEAIASGLLDPNSVFVYDPSTGKPTSLAHAIDSGLFNPVTNCFVDEESGKELSIADAIANGLVEPMIQAEKLSDQAAMLAVLLPHCDPDNRCITLPDTDEELTVKEAILAGALHIGTMELSNSETGTTVPLADVQKQDLIDPKALKEIYQALAASSLGNAIDSKEIDPLTGLVCHPETGDKLSVAEAIGQGIINPSTVFFVDETCHQVASLASFIGKGAFDPNSGCFVDPKDGRPMSMQDAIDSGLINPYIDPAEFVEEKFKLKDLLNQGVVSNDSGFVTPDGEKMSLAEALEKDYVTPISLVKVDPNTGMVVLADEEPVATTLKQVNEDLSWLAELENRMAAQPAAQDEVDGVKSLLFENEKLLDEFSKKEAEMSRGIENALGTVEERKNTDLPEDEERQLNRLRFGANDLKVRQDAARSQLEDQQNRLQDMTDNLVTFEHDAEKFSDWLKEAGKKVSQMRAENTDELKEQAESLKALAEEIAAHEPQLSKLHHDGSQLKQDAKEYDEVKAKFAESLPTPVSEVKREPLTKIDSTLDCLQGNFDNLLAECSEVMSDLNALARAKAEFNKLAQQLENSVPLTEEKISEVVNEPVSTSSEVLNAQLDNIRDIKGEIADEVKHLEDLKKAGEGVKQKLQQRGADNQLADVDQVVDDFDARIDEMQDKVKNKEADLNAIIVQNQDASDNLDRMLDWALTAGQDIDTMSPVSLDPDILKQQLRDHKVLQSDLATQLNNLPAVAEKAKDVPGVHEKVADLSNKLKGVEEKLQQRGLDLDDNAEKMKELQEAIQDVETWIASAVGALKTAATAPGLGSLKDKVVELHQQKLAKQPVMDKVKSVARERINSPKTGDKNAMREQLADIQGKWNDVADMLVEVISSEASRDMDDFIEYLDKAEAHLLQADPVSIDPETVAVQVQEHKSFDEELLDKTDRMRDVIKQCNLLLRETAKEESENTKNKLEHIRGHADRVCKLSADRLRVLEEALPLVSSFNETQGDLSTWLQEIEAEIQHQDHPAQAADEIKKQVDQVKQSLRFIDDHKPLVEDLGNTGRELINLCSEEEGATIKSSLYDVNTHYGDVRNGIRQKINELEEAFRAATTEVGDTVDGLLEELHLLNDQVACAEPIAASTEGLQEQLAENKDLIDDLASRQEAIAEVRDAADRLRETLQEDDKIDVEDLMGKVEELERLNQSISEATKERGDAITTALEAAQRFWTIYNDLMAALHDVGDNLSSLDQPHVESDGVKKQQQELKEIQDEFQQLTPQVEKCEEAGRTLAAVCGEPGQVEIDKHMEDISSAREEIEDGLKERQQDLDEALERAQRFEETMKGIMSWLPRQEEKLSQLSTPATNTRALRIQIEEAKVLRLQVHPKCVEVESLNQQASELRNLSPVGAEGLAAQTDEVTDRWNKLIKGIADREHQLQKNLVRLGELDHALDDTIGLLQQLEQDLSEMDSIYGDPRFIETHLKKIKLMQQDLLNYSPIVKSLNDAVTDMISAEGDHNRTVSPLLEKQDELNTLWASVDILARDRKNGLEDQLRQAKAFMGEVEDLIYWFGDFRNKLKSAQPLGALPETANKQFGRFMDGYKALQGKEEEVKTLLLNGEDMLARCRPLDAMQLRESLGKLRAKWLDAQKKADNKKKKLEEHLRNVLSFHDSMTSFTEWLVNAENILATFRYPSKLVDTCAAQIEEHQKFRNEIEKHQVRMDSIDKTGTYLKYFGRKQDTMFIKSQLVSIKLRWKKLVRKTDERGRTLQQAHKEDKRFFTSWRGLLDWLDGAEKKLSALSQSQASPAKVKECMEEVKNFEHQLSSKHPKYYSTSRLGRNLKDRCTKTDPEKEILQSMLDELKNKWCVVRSLVSQKQNKLEESLLMSGRFSDALQSFLEWLEKAEEALSEDQPILGDLDTVLMLIEQNKQFEQELGNRESMVATMKASADNNDPKMVAQLGQLTDRWENVKRLSGVRANRLQEALKLGEQFQDVVNTMRDWLPQAEAELKFRPLPDDELAIVQLIERHEKFEDHMNSLKPCMDKIRELGEEILQSCHPNALRFVKYYLTITQTRWDQALNRSKKRSKRLQDALKGVRGNAALLEELLAWLSEAQALLTQKERDPIPEDLAVVEALMKEHADLHDDLTNKNQDLEELTRSPSIREQQKRYGSPKTSYARDADNPRLNTLQTRWRNVWRMSVERKKKLQDLLDHLMELESFKNFDFDLWRQRYMNWIKAKKLRITDFFRRQDKEGRGILTREQFVDGMLSCGFPTNRTELNAVFDIFDRDQSGEIDYREFVEALRPRTAKKPKRPLTDSEQIHDEIERQVSQCTCRSQFKASKVGEGKYRFGDSQKLVLVRFLNSCVMVRVGGGWVTLQKFLESHDPCQAKGRTNTELREKFILPQGAAQSRASFSRRKPSADAMSTRSSSKASDAGYSSMHSGASVNGNQRFLQRSPLLESTHISGSFDCLSSTAKSPKLRRGKILASSMTNLASSRNSHFGGTNGHTGSNMRRDSASSSTSLNSSSSRDRILSPMAKSTPKSKKKH